MLKDINNMPIHEALEKNGYAIVDGLIAPEQFERLKEACDRVVAKARKGEWEHRRLVGTQFPPWTEGTDCWGVQHVIHPDLREPAFLEWYGSPALLQAVCELVQTSPDGLQIELFNLLINPENSDFDLTWHRDAIPCDATEETEREKLAIPHYGIQWNTALYPDDCLFVVPASHQRIMTAEERYILNHDPKSHAMPGQLQVHLEPGQTVFYNNNILHRAAYFSSQKRATLHASMGSIDGGHNRAAVVFQHGLKWMATDQFKQTLPPSLQKPYENTLAMAAAAGLTDLDASKPIHAM